METELAILAKTGATAVIERMATDEWTAMRPRLAALLRRDHLAREDADGLELELEQEGREAAVARSRGDATAIADLEVAWRSRLRRLFLADPTAAAALRALLAGSAPTSDRPGGQRHRRRGSDEI